MHRRIGILGGLSPESTITYYEHITRTYYERFGDYGYPEILIYSVNFQEFVDWQKEGLWDEAAYAMIDALDRLHRAGADFGIIAANTMHIVFEQVQQEASMPLLSIIDAAAEAIHREGLQTVGLLGTVFTMSQPFYRAALARSGIQTLVPKAEEQAQVNNVIYNELTHGDVRPESREALLGVIDRLCSQGSQGIVLGCTELPLLVRPEHCAIPLFDTAVIHAQKALDYALGGPEVPSS